MTENIEGILTREIKFTHIENGELNFAPGDTALSYLFNIGALMATRKFQPAYHGYEHPTDIEGLKKLKSKINDTITAINIWTANLGEVLAFADRNELSDGLDSYGWLIAGLSESVCQLNYEAGEIKYALKQDQNQ